MMHAGFELFDHTADIGIRVYAPTLSGLIQPAVQGLYAVIGELATCGAPEPFAVELSGREPAGILRDFLAGLLLCFESDQRICSRLAIAELAPQRLRVRGEKMTVDPQKSVFFREVKAVTYHELAVREIPGGFEARFIVDI